MESENKVVIGLLTAAVFLLIANLFVGADVAVTGNAITGVAKVNVSKIVGINVTMAEIDFGEMALDSSSNTYTYSPNPIIIENIGSVVANLTINATDLFEGNSVVSSDFQYKAECVTGNACNLAGTLQAVSDVPVGLANGNLLDKFAFADNADEVELHIGVHVPTDEPAGEKTSTIVVIAVESE